MQKKQYQQEFINNKDDFTEKLSVDIITAQQSKSSGGSGKPAYLYQDVTFGKGEIIETLPEEDKNFNEKKRMCVKFVETYNKLLQTEINPDYCKRWQRRSKQVTNCGNYLVFQGDKLAQTLFCKVRLCPMCSWRRALKICMHTRQILTKMLDDEQQKFKFLFLTLTVPNVPDAKLAPELSHLLSSWRKMTHKTKNTRVGSVPDLFNKNILGWYRGLEITRNLDEYEVMYYYDSKTGKKQKLLKLDKDGNKIPNPNYLTWHPHFHCILVVPEDYDRQMLNKNFWLNWWRWATGDSSITQVKCEEFRPAKKVMQNKKYQEKFTASELESLAIVSGVAEAAKYTVKSTDFYLDADATKILDLALERRQLVAFGGIMSKYRDLLQLDDEIDGDLVSSSDVSEDVKLVKRCYAFSVGFNCYIRLH